MAIYTLNHACNELYEACSTSSSKTTFKLPKAQLSNSEQMFPLVSLHEKTCFQLSLH